MYPRSLKTYDGYFKVSFPGAEFLGSTSEYKIERKICRRVLTSSIVRHVGKFHSEAGSDSVEMYQKA